MTLAAICVSVKRGEGIAKEYDYNLKCQLFYPSPFDL